MNVFPREHGLEKQVKGHIAIDPATLAGHGFGQEAASAAALPCLGRQARLADLADRLVR